MKIHILLLFVLVACSSRMPFVRSEYLVLHVDEFIVSNAYVHPTQIDRDEVHLSFSYRVIIKNQMNFSRNMDLANSTIMIGLRKLPISCKTLRHGLIKFEMKAEETLAVDCLVKINKAEGIFQVSDYKAIIEVPLEKKVAQFPYLLRAEDFQ